MFSMTTVPLSTRIPTASAKPPSVMVLSVWPPAPITITAVMIDNGIAARIITVKGASCRGKAGSARRGQRGVPPAPPISSSC